MMDDDSVSSFNDEKRGGGFHPSMALKLNYINNVASRVNKDESPFYNQDPHRESTKWPSLNILFLDQKRNYDSKKEIYIRDMFNQRYDLFTKHARQMLNTCTQPYLYNIRPSESYKSAILDSNALLGSMSIIMKLTPLYDWAHKSMIRPSILQEIYNEIIIAYFLNDLLHGHNHVQSIHFTTLIDWFIVKKSTITTEVITDKTYHQAVILERADISLNDYLLTYKSANVMKAVLFQLFHSLEVAWQSSEFIHHEPHLSNIMLKVIENNSPLKGKHFIYKRGSSWCKIEKKHLNNHYVKIIDYGRSRMRLKDDNDRLIEASDYSHLGYSHGSLVNRHVDVYAVIFGILCLNQEKFWHQFTRDPLHVEFFRFCDAILPFTKINHVLNNMSVLDKKLHPNVQQERTMRGGGIQNTSQLVHCTSVLSYLIDVGVFLYKRFENDTTTVSTALNHTYFDEYRQNGSTLNLNESETSVVVSFTTPKEDGDPNTPSSSLSSSTSSMDIDKPCCSVCENEDVRCVINDGNTFLCESKQCYDLMHLFNSKTVYR
jgi:hypothetical protein